MGLDKPVTVTEIVVLMDNKYSTQKISAMLAQMQKEETVVKTVEGKKSLFSV